MVPWANISYSSTTIQHNTTLSAVLHRWLLRMQELCGIDQSERVLAQSFVKWLWGWWNQKYNLLTWDKRLCQGDEEEKQHDWQLKSNKSIQMSMESHWSIAVLWYTLGLRHRRYSLCTNVVWLPARLKWGNTDTTCCRVVIRNSDNLLLYVIYCV